MATYRKSKPVMTKETAKKRIAAAIKKKRTSNKPVNKTYFRRGVNKNSNYSAITTLARQVKQLQLSRYGFKQFQHQHIGYSNDPNLTSLSLTQPAPLAFMANNFYEQARLYYGTKTGVAPNLIASYAVTGLWTKVRSLNGLSPDYNWNQKQAEDTVSHIHYLPISTTFKIRFKCASIGPNQTPIRCRVTVLKLKTSSDVTNIHAELPTTLGAYSNLVDRDPLTRQYLNTSQFHNVLFQKDVYFAQTNVTHNDVERFITYKHLFSDNVPVEFDKTNEPNEDMRHNIPNNKQVWVLINTDNVDGARLNITMERWNVWRDPHGVGN